MTATWAMDGRVTSRHHGGMRVAHVMAGSPMGGAELFYERLVLAQAAAGDDVLAVIRGDPGREARLRAGGVVPVTLPFRPVDPWTGWRLRGELRRFAPRVAVAWMGRAASAMPRGPWVSVGRLGGDYDLRRFRRCDRLVANTRTLAESISVRWHRPATLLPNFAPDLAGAVPAALPVPAGARTVLALGRLHPNKAFDTLIAAAALLPPGVHVVIAGEGPARAALSSQARALGVADRVHLIGWREDTGPLLAAADVLCCPSRVEPLGNVVLEAFSARTPVVAAASDGPRGLIADGRTGLLVPIDDPAALAAALAALIQNPKFAVMLATGGRARYEACFAEAPVLARWRDFLATWSADMCGIAGIMLSPQADGVIPLDVIEAMTVSLAHRGPDGSGHTTAGRVALIHNRLAIIDLHTGDQPLYAGTAALVANGEVYNYRELRAGLSEVNFTSNSDCEPPLHLWLRDGPAYAERLRGMFAIAIHERSARTVTLTRDPFGIKPLYVTQYGNGTGGLAFASEPSALLNAGLQPRKVRAAKRDELLQLQFTTGTETIFEGVDRVLPGETLTCADGHIIDRRRVPSLPAGPPEAITEAAALKRLDAALMESVDLHQRSDVPYGMFLSGGIDSSAILALMARLNETPVLAFTAGWDVAGAADERAHAALVARAAGARHETLEITEAMVWRHLPEIVAAIDDPAADYAIIPTWFLARRARQDVKVVLSGEGGDEIFGGYGRYRKAMRPWWLGGRSMRVRGPFDRVAVLRSQSATWRDGYAASEAAAAGEGRSRLGAAQATDVADWLPNDLLLKLDRCLMAHAVEGRTPFLDPGVAAAAFRLPDDLKVRGRSGKWLLRKWLETALPESQPWAPKQGFTVPIGEWIAASGARLGDLVAASPGVLEIADPDRVRALFRSGGTGWPKGHAMWTLLFYALWHRRHILGLAPVGDVFETLSVH